MSEVPTTPAKVHYLSRVDLYSHQKPYVVDSSFDISNLEGVRVTNRITEEREVNFVDVRAKDDYGLDSTGWTYLQAGTMMSTAEFDDPTTVETKYYDELVALLQDRFPQYSSIAVLDHVVRKRSPKFPAQVGAAITAEQPLALVHSDFSPEGAKLRTEGYRTLHFEVKDRPYDMLK
jgi:hypothetical protein